MMLFAMLLRRALAFGEQLPTVRRDREPLDRRAGALHAVRRRGRPRDPRTWLAAHNAAVMAVLFIVIGAKLLGSGLDALLRSRSARWAGLRPHCARGLPAPTHRSVSRVAASALSDARGLHFDRPAGSPVLPVFAS